MSINNQFAFMFGHVCDTNAIDDTSLFPSSDDKLGNLCEFMTTMIETSPNPTSLAIVPYIPPTLVKNKTS